MLRRLSDFSKRAKFDAHNATKYAGWHTVTLIPGDGVGNEISESVKQVFKAAQVPVEWEQYNVSGTTRDPSLLRTALDSMKHNKVGLKGILHTPKAQASLNVSLRKELDLYASVSFVKNAFPSLAKRSVDFVIIRENTEGEYSGLEHQPCDGVVESLKVVTEQKSKRIAKFAFDFAVRNSRKKVTCVHKANIMKLTDGLFLRTCQSTSELYKSSGIALDAMIVDNTAMQLVSKPSQFDVVVTGNLYGSIVSNIGAGLVGGPGMVPGVNIGRDYAVFEPGCRHVGKDIAGQNKANPTALLMSAILMLEHLQLEQHATRISKALFQTLELNHARTFDLGGTSKTTEFTNAIIKNLE